MVALTTALAPGFGLDPDLQAWVERCTVPPDINFLFAANQFVQAGKAVGWWHQLTAIYFFCAPTLQAAQQNVRSNRFNLAVSSTPPSFLPYIGMLSARGQYLYTGAATIEEICGTGLANTNMIGVYNHNISTWNYGLNSSLIPNDASFAQIGASDNSNQIALNINATPDTMGARLRFWNNSALAAGIFVSTPFPADIGPGLGLLCSIRTNNSSGVAGIIWASGLGALVWPPALTDTPPVGNSASLYFLNGGSGTTTYCPNPISFGFAGPFTTDNPADLAESLSSACDAFLQRLGSWVNPIDPSYSAQLPPPPPNCFDLFTLDKVLVATPISRVFQYSGPPASDANEPDYLFYPLTDCITDPAGFPATTQTQVGIWENFVPDRALGGMGPIYPPDNQKINNANTPKNSAGLSCGVQFNTYDQAIGSTLVRLMYSAGYLATGDPDGAIIASLIKDYGYHITTTTALGWLDAASAFGFDTLPWMPYVSAPEYFDILYTDTNVDTTSQWFPGAPSVVHWQYANQNADSFFYGPVLGKDADEYTDPAASQVCYNMVLLGQGRLCDLANPIFTPTPQPIRGFFLDWETNDNRADAVAPNGVTDLFTVTALLLAAAAHGKGLQIGVQFDPLDGSGRYVGLNSTNAGLVLADATPLNPGGGLDFVNIVTSNAPPALPGSVAGDLQGAYLQAQLDIFLAANPAVPRLSEKLLIELAMGPVYQEIPPIYAASARNFLLNNGISMCSIQWAGVYPGGALDRPYNQSVAAFLGLPLV